MWGAGDAVAASDKPQEKNADFTSLIITIVRRNIDSNKNDYCNNTTDNKNKINNDDNNLVKVLCRQNYNEHNEQILVIFKRKTQQKFRTLIEERRMHKLRDQE